MTNATTQINRYFDRAPGADTDSYFALFADDAVVQDDGAEYRGIAAIRAWRSSVPKVSYAIESITSNAGGDSAGVDIARVDIAGDFPGSPVRLSFQFAFDADGRVTALTIKP